MATLRTIVNGVLADAEDLNFNFNALNNDVSNTQNNINSVNSSLSAQINNTKSSLENSQAALETELNESIANISATANSKVSQDLSNINATGKANIARYSKPNYSAGISKAWNTQYTAETNGWIRAACTCGTQNRNHWWYLYINGIAFKFHNNQGDWDVDGDSILLPIAKGQTYKATEGQDWKELTFYPDII